MAEDEAPPPYEPGNADISAPPPAAFGQVPPDAVQPNIVPGAVDGGETFQDTIHTKVVANEAVGGGENIPPRIIYVQHANDAAQYPGAVIVGANNALYQRQPPSDKPRDLFHFKLRDPRVNAFSSGRSATTSHCCCHLQIAGYSLLALCLIWHAMNAWRCLNARPYAAMGNEFEWMDFAMGAYSVLNMLCNALCWLGMALCRAKWIRPQWIVVLSYIATMLLNLVLSSESMLMAFVGDIVAVCVVLWMAWIFRRIHHWAVYFENGGRYDAAMLSAPKPSGRIREARNEVAIPQAQPAHGVVTPDEGVGDEHFLNQEAR